MKDDFESATYYNISGFLGGQDPEWRATLEYVFGLHVPELQGMSLA
jgi:hypothetical protein